MGQCAKVVPHSPVDRRGADYQRGELLGIELERHADFRRWGDDMVHSMGGAVSEDERAHLRQNLEDFRAYCREIIEHRRREPRNDLITALVQAQEEKQALSTEVTRLKKLGPTT